MLETPPWYYLHQVAQHCPKAVATYLILWKNKDEENQLRISLEDVRHQFISLKKFRHNLRLLCNEGLISYKEKNDFVDVEMVGWEKEFDDDLLYF